MRTSLVTFGIGLLASVSSIEAWGQQTLYSPDRSSHFEAVCRQASRVGDLAENVRRDQELRARRQRAFLDTMYQVEASAVQFPDDLPVRYPAPDIWRELSARRAAAQDSRDAHAGQTTKSEIERVLNTPTEIDFQQVPLADVIEELRKQHGLEVQLDRQALEAAGVATDTPITKRLRGLSLKSALRHVLREFDLTYVVQDEVVLITTKDAARKQMERRLYYIGDLMRP